MITIYDTGHYTIESSIDEQLSELAAPQAPLFVNNKLSYLKLKCLGHLLLFKSLLISHFTYRAFKLPVQSLRA